LKRIFIISVQSTLF